MKTLWEREPQQKIVRCHPSMHATTALVLFLFNSAHSGIANPGSYTHQGFLCVLRRSRASSHRSAESPIFEFCPNRRTSGRNRESASPELSSRVDDGALIELRIGPVPASNGFGLGILEDSRARCGPLICSNPMRLVLVAIAVDVTTELESSDNRRSRCNG